MLARLRRSGGGQFAAAILIFALTLQGMALAIAAAGAVDSTGWTGFEICRHSPSTKAGGNAAAPGSAPEQQSDPHCIFCLAGAMNALGVPPPDVESDTVAFLIVPWTFMEWKLPAQTVDSSARARAPPPA